MIFHDRDNELNGLVLAGGKSSRMGKDKALLDYHGVPQFEFAYRLLQKKCNEVFISCRNDQQSFFEAEGFATITDCVATGGPLGAIHSALSFQPGKAWLVLACDLPLMDEMTLDELISNRDKRCMATCYISPFDQMPEPLIAIWEAHSGEVVHSSIAAGLSCPRKVLLQNKVTLVRATHPEKLANVNTPAELDQITNRPAIS